MDWLLDPLSLSFLQRGLLAGVFAALTCSLVGIWVVLRGLSFMGDALAHGIVPGVALGVLLGFDVTLGAVGGAALTVGGVTAVTRYARLSEDTSIGLLFVGMLALGVIIISKAGSWAVDLAAILFGGVLGVTTADVVLQAVAAGIALLASVLFYRAFLALAFDERKAALLGLRPRLARAVLLALVAMAVVASFRTVGALLVFGLLIAPPATGALLARRVPVMMAVSATAGCLAVSVGLLISYYFDLAAGATMAFAAVAQFFVVLVLRGVITNVRDLGRAALGSRR